MLSVDTDPDTNIDSSVSVDMGTAGGSSSTPESSADGSEDGDATGPWPTLDGWTAVPGSGSCDLRVADVSKVTFPKRSWASCGVGCRSSAGIDSAGDVVFALASSVDYRPKEPLLLSVILRPESRLTYQISSLETGATQFAVTSIASGAIAECPLRPANREWLVVIDRDSKAPSAHVDDGGVATWSASWTPLTTFATAVVPSPNGADVALKDGRILQFGASLGPPTTLATES